MPLHSMARFAIVLLLASVGRGVTVCTSGLSYCGYNVFHKNDYIFDMLEQLENQGPRNICSPKDLLNKSLWHCRFGRVHFQHFCKHGCVDLGKGQSDNCDQTARV
ncbi:hypothetical protein XA68_10420 [Ophiocordyceps unilateralis]|uniref:Secreted protein n=1 Tax=Ophiocordyceps unilateralis TaxID=268505 RepID=A0A2A9PNR8_OPHUN|nr:hypothetical protein XA68_10420 [Ophiocordyceps unilateralis]